MAYLKTGTSSKDGEIKVITSVSVTKVVINCHSWTTGTANQTVKVNGSAAQTASTSGTATDLTFEISGGATELDMVFINRVFIASIAIYTE